MSLDLTGGKWKCATCGAEYAGQNKLRRKKDYRRANIGQTCSLELVRRIHES